ncbi:solute:sodium symporter family transporter [Oceanobacillus polygoni]|uniref:SSS family solute:Na+ symporter n=1 Tax=Oceanobacillus polygoni TaxID=1235259 RepID=A0A9X1CDA6_9BACI|nr:solute:sodium symporter family transporter [Oceanobacillus polygoni]MBP2075985.1 SSS family solute:Na+ symporter [Oceanobacillus polygoni]
MNIFVLFSFILIVGGIGIYGYIRSRAVNNKTAEGFFLGGRSLTGFTIAGTVIMTNLSTEQLVGQNGQSYVAGMEVMAWEVTAAIALVFLALVFLPKYMQYGVDTIPDFIEIRYDTMTKRIVSFLFIFTYVTAFLPVVLYSGSLVFNKIFRVDELLGVEPLVAVALISAVIGVIGLIYLLVGGLSLAAFSDSIYGVMLVVGGLSIPVIGLIIIGDGSFLEGLDFVRINSPELLNAIGPVDSNIVPWPTLFLGMFFNNLYFWCTNQMIVQKTLAGRNLKEGQKGALYVAFFKIFGALFLVFPGIVAFNMFGDSIGNPDNAYPTLITAVLPEWAYGIFGAVIFGAILSSFVGSLNATGTLFTLDFYKPVFKKNATDRQVARAGKMVTVVVGLISIIIAPLISFAPSGLYALVQQFNGLYSMPLLAIVVLGFYSKYVTARGAKITFIFHIIAYGFVSFFLPEIHYLYTLSILFLLDVLILWLVGRISPLTTPFTFNQELNKVDLNPWKHRKLVSAIVIIVMIGAYVVFSPLILAK